MPRIAARCPDHHHHPVVQQTIGLKTLFTIFEPRIAKIEGHTFKYRCRIGREIKAAFG